VLHTFSGGSGDGANPMADVVFDTEGNLYGVASSGGSANCNGGGCGVVFELSPKSGSWTETILYVFAGASDGRLPAGDLIWDAAGNLYVQRSMAAPCTSWRGISIYSLTVFDPAAKFFEPCRYKRDFSFQPPGRHVRTVAAIWSNGVISPLHAI